MPSTVWRGQLTFGLVSVPVRLHREVTIELQVKVQPEGEVILGHLSPEEEASLAKSTESETTEASE